MTAGHSSRAYDPSPGGGTRPGAGTLYRPRPVAVAERGGRPRRIGGIPVEGLREEWLVEDRWWTPEPLRRHYFELVLADGRCTVVFRDLVGGGWYAQRG